MANNHRPKSTPPPVTCHHCGCPAGGHPFTLSHARTSRLFCDSDCLREWLAAQQELFEARLRTGPGVAGAVVILEHAFYTSSLDLEGVKRGVLDALNALTGRAVQWDPEKHRAGLARPRP